MAERTGTERTGAERAEPRGDGRTVFHTLDLLRGVAAIAVVMYHKKALPLSSTSAYLAVDLFFLLSGVVVSEAYAGRLAGGWSVGRFALVRVVRLWPLYMVGTLISLVAIAVTSSRGTTPFWHGSIAKIVLFAVFFLPGMHSGKARCSRSTARLGRCSRNWSSTCSSRWYAV